MIDAIEGRWLMDFGAIPLTDPVGNEFLLNDGTITSSGTGRTAGHYEVQSGHLIITLPMPAIAGDGPWEIVARLLLPESLGSLDRLFGVVEAIMPGEPAMAAKVCILVRQHDNA